MATQNLSGLSSYKQDKTQQQLQDLADKLRRAVEKLKEQDEFIQQVAQSPKQFGIVVNRAYETVKTSDGEKGIQVADVLSGGGVVRYFLGDNVAIYEGNFVSIIPGKGIYERCYDVPMTGPTSIFKRLIGSKMAEVTAGNNTGIIYCPDYELRNALKEGDKIQLDPTGSVILFILPEADSPVTKPTTSRVTWDMIGGHHEAKQAIQEAIIWPIVHRHLVTAYGQRPGKGVLFYGPPGCGKTLIAKATATQIAGDFGDPGFFSVKGPELMNPYVGETERAIRELFKAARKHQQAHGTRAVIFIDEADSCLGHRGRSIHNDISVPAFLVEMDGLDDSANPLVILATNRPNDLDTAIVREGRIDRRIKIDRPTSSDVKDLFALYLARRPAVELAATCDAAAAKLQTEAVLWNNRSGAMVAALVDRATSKAMERDIKASNSKPTGITQLDCLSAIEESATQYKMSV